MTYWLIHLLFSSNKLCSFLKKFCTFIGLVDKTFIKWFFLSFWLCATLFTSLNINMKYWKDMKNWIAKAGTCLLTFHASWFVFLLSSAHFYAHDVYLYQSHLLLTLSIALNVHHINTQPTAFSNLIKINHGKINPVSSRFGVARYKVILLS